jgi:hypothetical protein
MERVHPCVPCDSPVFRPRSWRLAARVAAIASAALAAGILPAAAQTQPVPGQNINMVSGTQFPGGDPFLQRQNEPSLAVSSRNSLHLLAGANDYRTVDLPVSDVVPGSLAGDAWLGVFKSFDGAQSWQSTLLPGFPQDQSPEGLASPLKAYSAAADPTVRAGTSGLIYYSGIAFNRGTNNGAVFVARYLDANQKENGDATAGKDTVKYISTQIVDTGTSGQFIDKPWIAVDVPRAGAAMCTFNPFGTPQSFPAGNVYLVWSRFTGSTSTKIMFSRSLDCGKTWSNPTKLSESNSINQGTNMAIDPVSGAIYVTWRRFATSSQPDAIVIAKSTDFGKTFASKNTKDIASIAPFDQGTTPTQFRTNALPTMAVSVDAANVSRVHVAWAQRDAITGDARIVMSTSSDGSTWSVPAAVVNTPIPDDFGNAFSRGHQFMPQLTSLAGRVVLVYYDQRLDHTLGFHIPNNPFAPDAQGRFYLVRRDPKGELNATDCVPLSQAPPGGGYGPCTLPGGDPGVYGVPAHPEQVFTLGIDDATLTLRRHTVDLRVGLASAGAAPAFISATVSQYRFGLTATDTGTPTGLTQLQSNPPNLPLFGQGTLPFLGDYIDVAGQNFKANGSGGWTFNTSLSSPLVAYASWTDNRDVKPPLDGNWANYTPTGPVHTSVLDPTQQTPQCVVGQEGMRNQNIYSSRITEGLIVGSPQNVKPLSATLQRSFVVTLQNLTNQERTFHLTVTQPSGGQASFFQATSQTSLDVKVAARSGAARPVFAKSSIPAASFTVNVVESGGSLSGFVVMNPEGSVSPLAQPDGTTVDIGTLEIYTPGFQVWNPANPNPFLNISNPNQVLNISNLNISNVDPSILNISNLNISNLNISNLNISNPDPAELNISNLNISNTAAANLNISNLNISNLNISNAPLTDSTYAVTNSGNTAHSYRVALYGNNPYNTPVQVIVTKNSTTPASASCTLLNQPQSVVVSNVNDALIESNLAAAASPNIPDSSVSNTTMALAPGETAFVTLRAALTPDQMASLVRGLTPVITAHGANTNGSLPDFAALLLIQIPNGTTLPAAIAGVSYTTTLQATGGKAPLTWTVAPGTLPPGLTLSSGGVLSGTPTTSGSFSFTVQVTDSTSGTPQTATQTFQLSVSGRKTDTSIAFGANPIAFGGSTSVTVTVTDTQGSGTASSPTGTLALTGAGLSASSCVLAPAGAGAASCSVTVTPPSAGTDVIGATFSATSVHLMSGATSGLTVNAAGTSTVVVSSLNPSFPEQPVTFTATVTSPAGVPTGTVTFMDGATPLGTSALSGGTAAVSTVALIALGVHPIQAVYGGDANFVGSSSAVLNQTVQLPPPYTFTGFLSPMATAGTVAAPSTSPSANYGSATPIKWTLKDFSGNVLTDLSTLQLLTAVAYTGGACSGQATGTATVLYSPTTGAKGGSTFRNSNGQYIFNWDTGVVAGPGCYELILQLNDGSAPKATIEKLN